MTDILQTALQYQQRGCSVIPVGRDKKPLVPWKQYQQEAAMPEQIREWWKKWPNAMIGLVTGRVSGLCVIDRDDMSKDEIKQYLPDGIPIPTTRTPRGGQHLYFRMPDQPIGNNALTVPGCDFRGEGGYVVSPPSVNSAGKAYTWAEGLSICDVEPPPLPGRYISFINSFASGGYKGGAGNDNNGQHSTTNDNTYNRMFQQGRRDEDLFHAANCLVRGGMAKDGIDQILDIIARNCEPPFSEADAARKVQSALERAARKERNLTQDIREWVLTTSGNFLTTNAYKELHLTTREEQKAAAVIFGRLVDEKLIEKYGDRRGSYRTVDRECDDIDFLNASDQVVDIRWPFQIEQYVTTLPKNIIVIAGEPNAGKTAFLLNTVLLNMNRHEVWYFSSEMGAIELRERLSKFQNVPLTGWKFKPKERASNFADVVVPDAINIIDFLEIHDEFYKVGGMIKEIYDKLRSGIAIIALQKNKGVDYGLGGMRSLEKARLYLTMEPHIIRIVKGKNWTSQENPNGLECRFKLIGGCKVVEESYWRKHTTQKSTAGGRS
jgi:hypothetical protein